LALSTGSIYRDKSTSSHYHLNGALDLSRQEAL
jgi:hypothetical protein